MKSRIIYLLIPSVLLLSIAFLYFNRNDVSEQLIPFEYKITPKDTEWKNFKTHEEMVAACRIPSDIVKKMTTEQLVDAVMSYPLLVDVVAFNTEEEGIQALLDISDAFLELTKRQDSGKYLSDRLSYLSEKNLPGDSLNIKIIQILLKEKNVSKSNE